MHRSAIPPSPTNLMSAENDGGLAESPVSTDTVWFGRDEREVGEVENSDNRPDCQLSQYNVEKLRHYVVHKGHSANPAHDTCDAERSALDVKNISLVPAEQDTAQERCDEQETAESESEDRGDQSAEITMDTDDIAREEADTSNTSVVADKIFEQLVRGFHGCSLEQHVDKLSSHMEDQRESHSGIEYLAAQPFPSVLANDSLLAKSQYSQSVFPSPQVWKAIVTGAGNSLQSQAPRRICLHSDDSKDSVSNIAFDIDSVHGFATSLAVARHGIWYYHAPLARQNIKHDEHIESGRTQPHQSPSDLPSENPTMIKDVAHLLVGRIGGAENFNLHVLFPHLGFEGKHFRCLTNQQVSRWIYQIFHPAARDCLNADYMQHPPATFRLAFSA